MAPKTTRKTIAAFKKTQAFTLIELMVVIAIVAILASFGAPAYQDYIRKTRVAEAIQLVSGIKAQIAENAFNGQPFSSGLTLPKLTPYLQSLTVSNANGGITLVFNATKFNGNAYQIYIVPVFASTSLGHLTNLAGTSTESSIPDGGILWGCRSAATTGGWTAATMPAKYVPESCIGNPYQ